MKSHMSLLMVFWVLIGFGCSVRVGGPPHTHYPPPYPPSEYPEEEYSNFDARIDAAKSIASFTTRDQTLSAIAIDASGVLDIEHTIRALSMISSFTAKDDAADKCATPFINENMLEDAKCITNQISSFSTKDRVLARIAQGPSNSI
ncbi:MAG: hypothetical protein JW787_15450 [Sedimentisphaerales bacterium]|nr:hypothetical protein [Sedimentisphaerales bacterium]